MTEELPEHIYFEKDIYKAFDMGVETGLALFEQTLGLSYDNQKYILSRIKNMLIEDNATAVTGKC